MASKQEPRPKPTHACREALREHNIEILQGRKKINTFYKRKDTDYNFLHDTVCDSIHFPGWHKLKCH